MHVRRSDGSSFRRDLSGDGPPKRSFFEKKQEHIYTKGIRTTAERPPEYPGTLWIICALPITAETKLPPSARNTYRPADHRPNFRHRSTPWAFGQKICESPRVWQSRSNCKSSLWPAAPTLAISEPFGPSNRGKPPPDSHHNFRTQFLSIGAPWRRNLAPHACE